MTETNAPVWPTMIASHRGGAMEWPENSPTAFHETAKLPVEMVEFDIHPSADGELVVIHDATLDRTTNGTGPVVAQSWAGLQQLTLQDTDGERLLRLEELIEIFRPTDIMLRLETKPGVGFKRYPGIELA
ncbi:MAG: glycerophosphodiester phosphodiesterase family protein, partial [Pseudomonadota bacterium]